MTFRYEVYRRDAGVALTCHETLVEATSRIAFLEDLGRRSGGFVPNIYDKPAREPTVSVVR